VAVDIDRMEWMPEGPLGLPRINLVVGALLAGKTNTFARELAVLNQVRFAGNERTRTVLLYEKELHGIRPGSYGLRAYVRDRWSNLFGGAAAEVTLPEARTGGRIGPIVLGGGTPVLRNALPEITRKWSDASEPVEQPTRIELASVPVGDTLLQGTVLEFHSWTCPPRKGTAPGPGTRSLVRDDRAVREFPDPRVASAGRCVRNVDVLRTDDLTPGDYVYELEWQGPLRQEARRAAFVVLPAVESLEASGN
jgi:hypothetical protein